MHSLKLALHRSIVLYAKEEKESFPKGPLLLVEKNFLKIFSKRNSVFFFEEYLKSNFIMI